MLIVMNSCSTQEATLEKEKIVEKAKYDYPVAMKKPSETKIHDDWLIDNYSWMKDKERKNKKVLDYIEEENKYAKKKAEKIINSKK